MSKDKAEYFSSWKTRVLPARRNWPCTKCGGIIRKGTTYLNMDDRQGGGRWQHREHLDCQAAWWQVELKHLLKSLGNLPHTNPPEEAVQKVLEGIPVTLAAQTETIGRVEWSLPRDYQQRLLHTPNLEVREAAMEDIRLALGLVVDCFIRVSGQREASMQLSNILQQLRQVAATATANSEYAKK